MPIDKLISDLVIITDEQNKEVEEEEDYSESQQHSSIWKISMRKCVYLVLRDKFQYVMSVSKQECMPLGLVCCN